ncbi:Neither inactivation nor afterpotential protein C [Amphibalanus amphitrite]|uniref:Neither inactivation nor afterpotential protein C n=1 Tax=Amphibalanus amphitrite TaxID=1232801 RepID=A0A6A4VB75_AMPAM|nr:Neither inactivation nor afterpotential protein C [Amphibalanus amphitrite]
MFVTSRHSEYFDCEGAKSVFKVGNLGVVFDGALTWEAHVAELSRRCTGVLIGLSHARHCLPDAPPAAMSTVGCYLRVEELAQPDGLYQLGDRIAEGTYGEIFAATENSSGTKVAIKIVDNTEETFPDIEEEYRILKDLSVHQNIPKLHGIFKKTSSSGVEQIWMVMEYCSGGSVTDLVKRLKESGHVMKEDHIAFILHHTVQAACHLHRNHVIHRDIKGQNILMAQNGEIKLVDFGISRHLPSTMARRGTSIGTPYWMAPEVILCDQQHGAEYDIRADVWSLGITAIELGDGVPPLASVHPVRAMFQITRNPPPTLAKPTEWSQAYLDFIAECLEKNDESRPLMEEVATHPFLTRLEPRLAAIRDELAQLLADSGPAETVQPAQVTSKAGYLRTRPHSKSLEILQDDLAALEDVTDDTILNLLEKRFHRDMIYTFVADVLIAVNPYCVKPLYDAKTHAAYCSRARSDNAPHVYAVADRAHQDMAHHQRAQTIVFTGETGSGKTFNARMALAHLCHLGKSKSLAEKVLGAGFVLELLGSAATSQNAASTRQVRYFETTFTKTGRLSGVIVWNYMLERWRVTDTRPNDGTFNALYAYYYGLQQSGKLGIYKLQKKDDYRFLPKHKFLDPVDSAEKFKEAERTMDMLEISGDKQETVRKAMAAIILLGEVDFEDDGEGVTIVNKDVLNTVSYLLSVDEAKLVWSLEHRCRIVAGEAVKEAKTVEQARASRDALARLLYGRLVDSVVNWVNASFTLTRLLFGETNTVGLLDMYGFESRSTNYLEQLVVNAFNEQVQSFYNQSVFQWEMDDFRGDDLEVSPYTYMDNSATIDMLMKKGEGLLALLDESTLSEKASDQHFVGELGLGVCRERDYLDPEVFDTLRQSENPFIAPMFLLPLTKTGNLTMDREQAQREAGGKARPVKLNDDVGNKRFDTRSRGRLSQTSLVLLTQASCYRYSAMEVMHKLINSTAHFVRCVRSNSEGAADTWDTGLVAHQLKCMQIANTIAIRKDGYSQRIDFAEFLRRYQFLAFDFDETVEVTRENCRLLMVRLKLDGYRMGRQKIFLKYFNEEYMSRLYEHEVKKIAKVQAMIRAFLVRRRRRAGQPLDVTRLLASECHRRPRLSVTPEMLIMPEIDPPDEFELED